MQKCISGKNSYQNERDAEKAASLGMHLSKEKHLKLSLYKCLECFDYHLTSKKKFMKKGKK